MWPSCPFSCTHITAALPLSPLPLQELEQQLAAEAERGAALEAALAEAEARAGRTERERAVLERSMGAEIEDLQSALQVGY